MVDTVRDIVKAAMRKAKVLASGEPLSPTEGADALEALTYMVDAWTLEDLLIPVTTEVTKTLLEGVSEYTIGIYPIVPIPDNHIETPRPVDFVAAFIRDGSGTDYYQELMYVKTWAGLSRKSNTSRPTRFYVQNGWPLSKIRFPTVPYADETLHLMLIQPLAGILPTASLNDVINLPPGYKQALVYNLALHLQPEWGKDQNNTVTAMAIQGKKLIKRRNYQPSVLKSDNALTRKNTGSGTYIHQIEGGP